MTGALVLAIVLLRLLSSIRDSQDVQTLNWMWQFHCLVTRACLEGCHVLSLPIKWLDSLIRQASKDWQKKCCSATVTWEKEKGFGFSEVCESTAQRQCLWVVQLPPRVHVYFSFYSCKYKFIFYFFVCVWPYNENLELLKWWPADHIWLGEQLLSRNHSNNAIKTFLIDLKNTYCRIFLHIFWQCI